MSDCGCGCGGAGNCNEDLNSKVKNAQLSGNISYDGSNLTCSGNSNLNITTGDSLNSVIQKLVAEACAGSGNYLVSTYNNVTASGSVASFDLGQEVFGVGDIKPGEGVRVKVFGVFHAVNAAGGIDMSLNVFGDDGAGGVTSPVPTQLLNIPRSNGARFSIEFEVFRKNDGTDILYHSAKMDTQNQANLYLYTHWTGNPPAATFGLGFVFTVIIKDILDVVTVNHMTFEHIRP